MAFTSGKWCLLISIFEVLIFVRGCHLVRNGEELEMYLCNKTLGEDVTLILNHSVKYEVSHNGFCIVNTNGSIIIKSDSLESATINCIHQNYNIPNSTFGLAFINTSVVLTRVVFRGCGATLPSSVHERVNSSLFRFSNVHSATILFIQCAANICNINITYYYGFAFVAVNLQSSSFVNMYVSNSTGIKLNNIPSTEDSVGSGVLMLFFDVHNNDRVIQVNNNPNITLFNCTFFGNIDLIYNKAKLCVPDLYHSMKNAPFTVVNAAALTVIFNQQKFHPVVSIEQTHFLHNFGNLAATVLILMLNTTKGYIEISGDSYFDHNINFSPCYGSALVFYMIQDKSLDEHSTSSRIQVLNIINTTIKKHDGIPNFFIEPYGAVYLGVALPVTAVEFYFKNVTFTRNAAEKSGVCILATVYGHPVTEVGNVGVTLESIKAYNNFQSNIEFSPSNAGIFSFNKIHQVTINGSFSQPSMFQNNYGSVIDAFSSTIYLNGHVIFENNQAISGPAIHLLESTLYFNEGLNVTFCNNTAEQLGGAIFGTKTIYGRNPECVIQIPFSEKAIVNFFDNSARLSGNTIFASPIYNCYFFNSSKIVNSTEDYLKQFNIANTSNNDLLDISSDPYMMKVCDNKTLGVNHYPGETIHLSMCALDGSGNHVRSVVSVSLANYDSNGHRIKYSHLLSYEEYQVVKESCNNGCSDINVTIIHNDSIPSSLNFQEIYVLLSPSSSNDVKKIPIRLSNCPIGFILEEGICQCDHAFNEAFQFSTKCDINNLAISISNFFSSPWLGKLKIKDNIITIFGVSGECPLEFCKPKVYYHRFVFVNDSYMLVVSSNLSERVPICLSNRIGVLCGTCTNSYSVVFGSSGCYKCSNKWLWTILLYAVAGPLLIYLLYALRLTLTAGTLNGIIFYAQAANGGLIAVMKEYYGTKNILRHLCTLCVSFLSFLNLNLLFPLCFYNGMTELWKTGLSLVFPIYLLTIVVILIILSHYSTWLSNRISHSSVQVLVTVVHLSFSNLLLTIIYVFVSSVIYTSDKHYRVWYWDGTVEYMGQSHRILVIISLVVTLSLILPYIVFLLFAKSLIRRSSLASNYLRPVFEAIHAPYKEGKHHWFVARLLLLAIIYIVYIRVQGNNLYIIIAALLASFLIGQSLFHPFKNKLINLLDSSLMFNLTLIYVSLSYDSLKKSVVFKVIAVSLVIMTFFIVLVYHILWVTGLLIKIRRVVVTSRKWISDHITFYKRNPIQSRAQHLLNTDSFYGSCSQYREPILSDSH